MDKQQAKQKLLDEVAKYYEQYHRAQNTYTEGDRIPYAARVYDGQELVQLVDSALEFWLTAGRYAQQFESDFSSFLGVKHCCLVNSGSSANLLAFMALTSPLLGDRAVRRGDEVITVACGFPTTVTPMLQFGAVPVFLDVTVPQYNLNVSMLEKALTSKTKAVMLAHTMGNPFDIATVKSFCDKNGLWLVEDNCDALGSTYTLEGKTKYTGTFGHIGTSSFYPPHHMTMGEGGAVYTDDALLHKVLLSMRDWGRECVCPSGHDNVCGHRFDRKYECLPEGYDHKYVYSHFGYNLKATDMQAAVGCAQLAKLPHFIERRRENFRFLSKHLEVLGEELVLPEACPGSDPSWFGFLMTCKQGVDRNRLVQHLEDKGVQTRMLFAGNLIRHPCFDSIRSSENVYHVAGSLTETDRIMERTFWVGVYPGMSEEKMAYMAKVLKEGVKQAKSSR